MHRPHRSLTALSILAAVATACVDDDTFEPADEPETFRALESARGEYFELASVPTGHAGRAMRATGHLIVRLAGGPASTGPASPPTATDTAGTCGVTFVSDEIAVTAGHCLPGLSEGEIVEVRTPRTAPGFEPNPAIDGGMFPDYEIFIEPGVWFDRYLCHVRARCFNGLDPINCDITAADVSYPTFSLSSVDIGILECDALDGARHDHLDVADSIADEDRLAMPWYHELYARPTDEPTASDFEAHYVQKGTYATNFHYYGAGVKHQMLPLMSTDFEGSRWKVVDPPVTSHVPTNLRGCHGTSGSGVLSKETDDPRLVGPVATGHGSINGSGGPSLLCHVEGADNDESLTLTATHPDITRYFVDKYVGPSCSNPDDFPARLLYWIACDRLLLERLADFYWDFKPIGCPGCLAAIRFATDTRQAMAFDATTPFPLGLRPNTLGETYRASVRVWTNDFPTTVELRMGDTPIATRTLDANDVEYNGNDGTAVISGSFVSDASTSGPLTIATVGQSAAQQLSVSAVTLVRDGQTDAFDTMDRRMGYGVYSLQENVPEAVPMTFVASPDGGFAAGLDYAQRMVATGLALTADSRWHVQLSGDQAALRCGLVFADGSEEIVDCTTNDAGVVLDGTGHGEPAALFVEQTDVDGIVSLYDLVVTEVDTCEPSHDTCITGAALESGCDGCADAICDVDPYCCTTYWDSICVGEVLTVCDEAQCDASKGTCTHSMCATGAAMTAQCDSPPVSPSCTAAICNVDPYCCNNYWDGICVGEVGSVCGLQCG